MFCKIGLIKSLPNKKHVAKKPGTIRMHNEEKGLLQKAEKTSFDAVLKQDKNKKKAVGNGPIDRSLIQLSWPIS